MASDDMSQSEPRLSLGDRLSAWGSSVGNAITKLRASSSKKKALSGAGLFKVADRLMILPDAAFTRENTCANVEEVLDTYYPSHYLLVDIGVLGGVAPPCPEAAFGQQRLAFQRSQSLDVIISIAQAADRWWKAEPRNLVVLCCPAEFARKIAACCMCFSERVKTAIDGYNAYNVSKSNRVMAEIERRRLLPSQRRFLSDFTLVSSSDARVQAPAPELKLAHLVVHKVPPFDREGAQLLITVVQGNRFVYSSFQHGQGAVWVPSSNKDHMSVSVSVNRNIAGEATVKIYHVPRQVSTDNPRRLICNVNFHTMVASLSADGKLLVRKDEIDEVMGDSSRSYHQDFRIELLFQPVVVRPEDKPVRQYSDDEKVPAPAPASSSKGGKGKELAGFSLSPSSSTVRSKPGSPSSLTLRNVDHASEMDFPELPIDADGNFTSNESDVSDALLQQLEIEHMQEVEHKMAQARRSQEAAAAARSNSSGVGHSPVESTANSMTEEEKDLMVARALQAEFEAEQAGYDARAQEIADILQRAEALQAASRPEASPAQTPSALDDAPPAAAANAGDHSLLAPDSMDSLLALLGSSGLLDEPEEQPRPPLTRAASAPQSHAAQPAVDHLSADEMLARELQAQFDQEAPPQRRQEAPRTDGDQPANEERERRRHHRRRSSRRRYEQEPQRHRSLLSFSSFTSMDELVRYGYRRSGANANEIGALPEFKCTGGKYLNEECQVCKEKFATGEHMRILPCIHAYHRDCIDRWLVGKRTCPVCNRPIDQ